MNSFEQVLTNRHPDPTAWCRHHSTAEFASYVGAVEEALDLPNGTSRLPGSSVSFRGELTVDYLGECDGPQGSICHALSLRLGDDLEVITCVEADGAYGRLAYRGHCDAFQQIAAELRVFRGRCFSHLRDSQVAA
ncbi:hypothetical protein [Caulobacter sp. CCH9-E1]|uniref:hypothetical protein n=1 Tax=Caulobacter sp. CCH9-E1 TaxID=1768768 RepID=UPI00083247A6|nr:hypothetical protein [Caulobacter sp. CCH9-E1]